MILGTASYMAPEQALGKNVDRRAGAWAFGVVLCEMLTGSRAYDGKTVTDILRKVINEPLTLDDLPADTAEPVRWLLRRCLEHDRRNRLADLSTARLEIDDALAAGPSTVSRTAPVHPQGHRIRSAPRAREQNHLQ